KSTYSFKVQACALKKENESQFPHSYYLHATRRIFKSIFFEGWSSRGNNNILSSPCLRFVKNHHVIRIFLDVS
ncbi:MAG: hypothetical protein WA421_01370, partial [Nitrososphaeraceae archaeon]